MSIPQVIPSAAGQPRIETKEQGAGWNDSGWRFRLVSADGKRTTRWATYTEFCVLDGWAVGTEYALDEMHALVPMPLDEALPFIAASMEQSDADVTVVP